MNNNTFSSRHTNTFPQLLAQLGCSLAITTYQAGKLILLRSDGSTLNTHYRDFHHPTGISSQNGRVAVGTRTGIWTYTNNEHLGPKLEPGSPCDAAYTPRHFHATGDIAIHEIAHSDSELWAVATRFSCLATFDQLHSFIPRWMPPFVSELLPEDRCHLNGLAVDATGPRFCTAHGTANTSAGWRPDKVSGGVILDVQHNSILRRGLSMPHSPRLHDGLLWVCDSGQGALLALDPATGATLRTGLFPGFTRGLDFQHNVAFVGLSQIRQHNEFGGLPFTERMPVEDRKCGVWAIDTRSGDILAFLEFTAGVQEIFGVCVLPHRWPELITDPTAEACLWSYLLPPA
jgi:uncharacterized protein (TIGR03032 family)